ncbi:ABC transporter substrate-binding protein [Mucilaginibacter calamicampi]|uniref:ABC transporter substrate-binding protein n=1 Tax=Mucilaginibacter calamicampi TaxID=1302352 RepID=A0ABW2Z3V6_9SPHI
MLNLTEYQRERLELIEHKLKFVTDRPLVACITPAGNLKPAEGYVNELIGLAGGKALLFSDGQEGYDAFIEQNPDVVIILPESGSAISAMSVVPGLLDEAGFGNIKAVKNNRLYILDNDVFTGESLNEVDKTELLAEIIYPKQFIFGYEGQGWIKFGL